MSESDNSLEYAKEFWLIANAVTAFSIVQNVSFYILVGPHKSDLYAAVGHHRWLAAFLAILATGLYVAIIVFCNRAQKILASGSSLPSSFWKIVDLWFKAQMAAIVVPSLFALLVIYGSGP